MSAPITREDLAANLMLEALAVASERDASKGGSGWITAPAMATRTQLSVSRARRLLEQLWNADRIEAALDGRVIFYRPLKAETAKA